MCVYIVGTCSLLDLSNSSLLTFHHFACPFPTVGIGQGTLPGMDESISPSKEATRTEELSERICSHSDTSGSRSDDSVASKPTKSGTEVLTASPEVPGGLVQTREHQEEKSAPGGGRNAAIQLGRPQGISAATSTPQSLVPTSASVQTT